MAERLAHRDLRNRSAEVLREVATGASYEITNHGEVVALLSPVTKQRPLTIRRATMPRDFATWVRASRIASTEEALDDLRGDR